MSMLRIIRHRSKLASNPLESGDFMRFGILPFFQDRLNHMLLPKTAWDASGPSYNAEPFSDQRKILSVLHSGHNVMLKGGNGTGKSLALLLYALNHSLSDTPRYGLLHETSKLKSVVVVPTNEMVDRYEEYTRKLLEGAPEKCCPDQLRRKDAYSDYELTRSALTVQFRRGEEKSHYSTCEVACAEPRVLVSTIDGLASCADFSGVKFCAVDNMDVFCSAPTIGSTDVSVVGRKQRYRHKIEHFLQEIQRQSTQAFANGLRKRLSATGANSKIIEEVLRENKKEVANKIYSRLVREKRAVLYKPIQYAFVALQDTPYRAFISDGQDVHVKLAENAIRLTNEQRSLRQQENMLVADTIPSKPEQIDLHLFAYRNKKSIVPITIPQAPKHEVFSKMDAIRESDWKNTAKSFLKNRAPNSCFKDTLRAIEATVKHIEGRDMSGQVLMVLPGYIDLSKVKKYPSRFVFTNPLKMLSEDLTGHVVVFGLDSVVPTFAYRAKYEEKVAVTGLVDPMADLMAFMAKRVGKEKSLWVVLIETEHISRKQIERDREKFQEILELNGFNKLVDKH